MVWLWQGERTRLRPLRRDDAALLARWRNEPAVRDGLMGYRLPVTEEMELAWIEDVLADRSAQRAVMAVEDRLVGGLAGFVQIRSIDWVDRTAELGVLIGRDYRCRGLGREATTFAVSHAFDVLNLRRLWLRVHCDNAPAVRLYQSLGFSTEGTLRRHAHVNGQYRDVMIMGLLIEERLPGREAPGAGWPA